MCMQWQNPLMTHFSNASCTTHTMLYTTCSLVGANFLRILDEGITTDNWTLSPVSCAVGILFAACCSRTVIDCFYISLFLYSLFIACVHRRASSVNFSGAQNFCVKICITNQQNARILHDSCRKNAQILHKNCPKNVFFRNFRGARAPPPLPPCLLRLCVCTWADAFCHFCLINEYDDGVCVHYSVKDGADVVRLFHIIHPNSKSATEASKQSVTDDQQLIAVSIHHISHCY